MMSSPPPTKTQVELREALGMHRRGELGPALQRYARVLKREPQNPIALHYASLLTRQLNDQARKQGKEPRHDEMMRLMELSVQAAPWNAGGVHNLAKLVEDSGDVLRAKALYEQAIAVNPELGESWVNLGHVYGKLGNRMRQEAAWIRALECAADTDDSRFNLSFLRLLKGDFERGWQDYESRWGCPEFAYSQGRSDLSRRVWRGPGDFVDVLYVHQEQGAGDAIMMARYIELAKPWCNRLIVEVIRGLVPLFMFAFPDLQVVPRDDKAPRHSARIPMMSLPAVFKTTIETIPCVGDRFRPESLSHHDDRPWNPTVPGRIGLCWRGSETHVNDRIRSLPFEATFPLLDVDGVTWQSLQFGYETGPPLDALPIGSFLDTARAIASCSLVITVDTSVAHLAGVMGVPVWVLLPFSAEFRWLQDRDDSPWYPSARLWRQATAGDWKELTTRVADAVREWNSPLTRLLREDFASPVLLDDGRVV